MRASTTVRMSRGTRDGLRSLASADGLTLDEEVTRLVRAERQRRMGEALARHEPDAEETAWLDMGAETARSHARW